MFTFHNIAKIIDYNNHAPMKKKLLILISIVFIFFYCKDKADTDTLAEVSIPNVLVSNTNAEYQPNETTIAINPTNPLNLIAGSNRKYYFYSNDGGLNWTQSELSTPLGVRGDPCVRFDNEGNAYYSHLSQVEGAGLADRMVVQKSTNGGATWDNGVGFEQNDKINDREWIGIDRTQSQYKGNIYVSWTRYDDIFNPNPFYKSNIICAYSNDKGSTWSDAVLVSDQPGDCLDDDNSLQGAKPTIGSNGEVYICWAGLNYIYFDKSLDGGKTFGTDLRVVNQTGGWAFTESISGVSRSDGCPTIACDISNSQYNGNLYVVWSDTRNGIENIDVFMKKSVDGGNTWSEIKKVNNDDSNRQQLFPNMAIDPMTGYIYIAFYDRRETIGDATDVYMAISKDGGESFENIKISTESFTPEDIFIGDYIDIAAYNGMVYPIWTTASGTSRNVIVALFDDTQ
jgi:hypothetical protein